MLEDVKCNHLLLEAHERLAELLVFVATAVAFVASRDQPAKEEVVIR